MKTIYRISRCVWDGFTEWIKEPDNQRYFCITLLLISVLPLLALSFYNHPAMDDFNYSVLVKDALREHQGLSRIPAVFGAGIQRAIDNWNRWQGTYAFSFICALRPSVFSEKLTFLQTFLLMGLLMGSVFYCCHVLLHRILGLPRQTAAVTASVILFLSIQYLPVGLEAFYWYCGSIGYTGMFSLLCILCTRLMWASHERELSVKSLIWIIILCLVTAGGMYPNVLFGAVFLFLLLVDVLAGKEYSTGFRMKYGVIFVCYMAGFFLNVLAPGNFIRQSNFQPRTPLEAIYKSYTHSLEYVREEGTNAVIILVVLALFVYMFFQMKQVKGAFRCPLMFTAVTYSLFVVLWVPGIYAVRFISGGRYYNVIFYGLMFFYAANAIYYAGWLRRRYESCREEVQGLLQKAAPVLGGILVLGSVVFAFAKVDLVAHVEDMNGIVAFKSIFYGEAAQYHKEIQAREALYQDPAVRYIVVDDTTVRPELLYYGTLTNEASDYRNDVMRQYYDKDYMLLIRPAEKEEASGGEEGE